MLSLSFLSLLLSGTPQEAQLVESTARVILYYLSPALFVLLYVCLPSPYGKLATPTWNQRLGPSLPARWAWFLFEVPNLLWAAVILWKHVQQQTAQQRQDSSLVCNYILYAFFVVHYLRRTLWYPLQMSPRATPTSLGVVLNALAYTTVNG